MDLDDVKKEWKILMVGVDDAGKTQILYKLKTGETVKTIPSLGYNVETVEYKDSAFKIWDIGGKNTIRVLWRYYCENRQGIIFVVDSSQVERMDESKKYLMDVLAEDDLKNAVLLVLANKQDLPNALNVNEITEKLDLNSVKNRQWHIQGTCAINGDGLNEGLDWLSIQLNNAEVKEEPINEKNPL